MRFSPGEVIPINLLLYYLPYNGYTLIFFFVF